MPYIPADWCIIRKPFLIWPKNDGIQTPNVAAFTHFLPQTIPNAELQHGMWVKFDFIGHDFVHAGFAVQRITWLKHSDGGAVQLVPVVRDILKVSFMLTVYFHAENVSNLCNDSFCHNSCLVWHFVMTKVLLLFHSTNVFCFFVGYVELKVLVLGVIYFPSCGISTKNIQGYPLQTQRNHYLILTPFFTFKHRLSLYRLSLCLYRRSLCLYKLGLCL